MSGRAATTVQGGMLRLSLPRQDTSPSLARASLVQLCEELDVDSTATQTARLLLSELVSNAVLHSTGPADAAIAVAFTVQEEVLRVEVADAGAGFTPQSRRPGRTDGGYGLELVDRASSRWGVEGDGRVLVWFELDL